MSNPRRIVAMAPDVAELAFALSIGDRLVAVSPATDYPAAAAALPEVDVRDVESVISFAPDLVLATTAGNDPRIVDRLGELGVPVFVADVSSCASLAEAYRLLGAVVDAPLDARLLADDANARCHAAAAASARLATRMALYVVWFEPLIVAGRNTFHDDLLRLAGLVNVAPSGAGRYPRVSPELLLDPSLEVIVVPDEPDVRDGYERLLRVPAGRRAADGTLQVLWLPADLANRPGPRLPRAVELLVAAREAAP